MCFSASRTISLVCSVYVCDVTDSVTLGGINRPAWHSTPPVGLWSIIERGWWAWSNVSSHCSVAW